MSDSIHQQIIDKLDTRLRTITKTNGYKTDAGENVFEWEDRDMADNELEAIVYRDRTKDITPATVHNYEKKMYVEFELKAKAGTDTAKRLREMIEDLYNAIGTDDRWDELAIDSQPMGEEMDIQRSDKITGSATVKIYIEYETEKWNY